jgi:predicted HAD superfamily Cof-like phosphohydrolase
VPKSTIKNKQRRRASHCSPHHDAAQFAGVITMPKSKVTKNQTTKRRRKPEPEGVRLAREWLRIERELAEMAELAAKTPFDEEEVLKQLHERLRKRAERLLGRR